MYEVNESIIDTDDVEFVINELPFKDDLTNTLRYATERMIAHRNVRGLVFNRVAQMNDERAVLAVWAPIPKSTRELYIEVREMED